MKTSVYFAALILGATAICAQTTAKSAPQQKVPGDSALRLAENGHCKEALPALKKSLAASNNRREIAMAGVRCAIFLNAPDAALEFARILERDFPEDSDVLYLLVHTYSDLSTRAASELATKHPASYEARELNAEALETQGKWQDAEKEYRSILATNPKTPGIHFRLGRLLLSAPNPPADMAEKAKKEFEDELAIDPNNAGAEYVLGELAKQANSNDDAMRHFTHATALDPSFAAAYIGLGTTLIAEKKYAEAIAPLESAVKLQPDNPAVHYNLATAYSRTGRKADADREFAIHNQMMQRSGGAPTPAQQ